MYTPQNQSNGFDESPAHDAQARQADDVAAIPTPPTRAPPSRPASSLQGQLEEANATIKALRAQLEEQPSLRRRKEDVKEKNLRGPGGDLGVSVLEHKVDGVPVKIVAILCLLVFLFTYLLL